MNGYYITGSDTGVGKTWVACQIVRQLRKSGHYIRARKPIESGCRVQADGTLFAADGDALRRASGGDESLATVTPYRYPAAVAPDRAARLQQQTITLTRLIAAAQREVNGTDLVIVEGAGGFYSPIAEDGLNADLARALGLKLVIVVADRLGAVNQALLTINAARCEQLEISAVILNQVEATGDSDMDNHNDLQARTELPVYHCRYDGVLPSIKLT